EGGGVVACGVYLVVSVDEMIVAYIMTSSLVGSGKVPLWRVRARSANEQQSPIRQRNIASIRSQSSVLCAVAVHDDHRARNQGFLREPRSYQRARRSRLDGPIIDASVGLFDLDVDP